MKFIKRESKGQTTIELLILLVVSVVALAIIYSLYAQQLEISSANQSAFMAKTAIQKIVTSANALALSGAGAETKIQIELPDDLDFENSGFSGKTIFLRLDTGSDLVGVAEVDLEGSFREVEGKQFLYLYYDGNSVKIHYNDFEVNKKNISIAATQGTIVTESFTIRNNSVGQIDFVITPQYSHSDVSLQIKSEDLTFTLESKEIRSIDINFVISSLANGNYSGYIDIVGNVGGESFLRTITLSAESYFVLSEIILFPKSVTFLASPNTSIVEDFSICNSSDNPINITSWTKDGNGDFSAENWFTLPSINYVGANSCEEFDITFNVPQLYVSGIYDTNITANLDDGNSYTSYIYFVINYVDTPYFSFRSVNNSTLIPNFNSSFFLSTRLDANNFDTNRIVASGELDTNLLQRNDYGSGTAFSKISSQTILTNSVYDINLIGLWHLDGDYIDSSGNMRHGTCTSCPSITQGLWDTNALEFNGTTSFVSLPNSVLTNATTVSMWFKLNLIKPDSGGLSSNYLWVYNGTTNDAPELRLLVKGDGKVYWLGYDNSAYQWNIATTSPVVAGRWYNVVGVFAPNDARLYLDGNLVGSDTSVNITHFTSKEHRLGAYSRVSSSAIDGVIEEFEILSRALNKDEILQNYLYQSSIINQNQDSIVAKDNLIGFWRFNDKNSSNYILNSKTGNRDGLLVGGADVNALGLRDTNAGFFDGSNDYVLLQNLNVNTSAGAKNTVSFWMKWNGVNTKMPFSWNSKYDLYFNSSCFGFNTYQANVFGISSTGLANTWVHVVAVFYNGVPDATNNSLYINGVKQNIYACVGSTTASKTVNSSARIGGGFDGYYIGANIEDFAIWNKELSQEEVTQIYALQKPTYLDGVVSLWNFNDKNSSGWILNSKTFRRDGNLFNGADVNAKGLWDTNAVWFNGTSGYVGLSNIVSSYPVSVSYWVKTNSATNGVQFCLYNSGVWVAAGFYNGAFLTGVNLVGASISSFTNNSWNHVVLVQTSGSDINVYVNGVRVTSATTNVWSVGTGSAIGRRIGLTSQFFNGLIEEFFVLNRALSDSEVSELYLSQAGNFSEPNLVGLWHLDNNANDSSGNNFHGTSSNVDLSVDCLWGTKCGAFNGNNSFVSTAVPLTSFQSGFSVSAWIYPRSNGGNGYGRIFDKSSGTSGNNGFYVFYRDNKIFSVINAGTTRESATGSIELNKWNHVVVTFSSNATISIYVNSVVSGTPGTSNALSGITTTNPFTIGNRSANTDRSFDGFIESPTIWDKALSDEQIRKLYTQQKGEWLDSNLVLYYTFNRLAGTVVPDEARGYYGTLVSGATNSSQGLWDSNALFVNNAGKVTTTYGSGINPSTQPISITGWVKSNTPSSAKIVFSFGNGTGTNQRMYVGHNSGKWTLGIQSTAWSGGTVSSTNKWAHLALIMDGNVARLYVDGILSREISYTSYSFFSNFGISIYPAYLWVGLVDEVKIYDRALSVSEIQADYNSFLNAKFVDSNIIDASIITKGSSVDWDLIKVNSKVGYDFGKEIEDWNELKLKGINGLGAGSSADYLFDSNLVGLWHLNDKNSSGWLLNSATGIRDANLNNGADVNAKGLWDTNAGFFDGVNDYVNISGLNNMTNGSMTFSAWIYRDEYSVRDVVFGSYNQSNNINFEIHSDNFVRIWWNNGQIDVRGTFPIPSNKWVLYTIVRNVSENKFYSYIDGELKNTFTGVGSDFVTTNQYFVGKDTRDGTTAFKGEIEEVAIWSRALSGSEVSDLYNSQKPMFQNGLVALWHLNDKNSDGWLLNSVTGLWDVNLNGGMDINGSGLWDTNAGYFDGSNDYVNVPYALPIATGKPFTLSAWVYPLYRNNDYRTIMGYNGTHRLLINNSGRMLSQQSGNFWSAGSGDVPDGKWTQVIYWNSGSVERWYINGIQSGADNPMTVAEWNEPFKIGHYDLSNYKFKGYIEEVAIWNRALTVNEIKDLYRKGVTRLDLNVYSCVDSLCATKSSSQLITGAQNGLWLPLSISDSNYFGYDVLFNSSFSGNFNNFWAGPFLQDVNVLYKK